MSGIYTVTVGAGGSVVLPDEVRRQLGLADGDTVTLVASPAGLVMMTRAQLQRVVRDDLAGLDLVGELLAEREGDRP